MLETESAGVALTEPGTAALDGLAAAVNSPAPNQRLKRVHTPGWASNAGAATGCGAEVAGAAAMGAGVDGSMAATAATSAAGFFSFVVGSATSGSVGMR